MPHEALAVAFGVDDAAAARAPLDGAYRNRVSSLCRLIDAVDFEMDAVASAEQKARALRVVADHAAAGRLALTYETTPLTAAAEAWLRQADPGHKPDRAAPGT
ncbi:hypothetical protein C1I99_06700 [Micromonospora deserti]|uniref:Uncharacterized protein n=1 Tax=Micromonospora deserti TaxID=2070366 RepID=A0A2W2DP16_9ACTN|nr:hypothetical protein C1I99_06700 [Micromonospora deserti]